MVKEAFTSQPECEARPLQVSHKEPRMKIKLPILIACACLCLLPGESFADPERATVVIENQTGKRVTYQFKWGADRRGRTST